ncbi:hypothetical protein EBR21_02155 [bacterium]|nr:hypothetical protein [bacterium]
MQKINLLRTSLFCIAGVFLSSCRAGLSDEQNSNTKICEVDLLRSEQTNNFAGTTTVAYTGALSADCQKKTTELTGKAQIYVAAQSSVSNAAVSLQELKAGQRNLLFDASSDNFLRGNYEKRFDSAFFPDWSLPWTDRPTIITLSMSISDSTPVSSLPSKARVELTY